MDPDPDISMTSNSEDKEPENIADLHEFTNVPHPAHSTKVPPPPPPPRHQSHPIVSEPAPSYTSLNDDFTDYPNNLMARPKTNIFLDTEIREKLASSLNQYNTEFDTVIDSEQISIDDYMSNRVDFYTDISKMVRKKNDVGVLLPLRSDLFESYLAPFLMVLAQIPTFSNLILKHEFLVFGYKPNWWNREKCSDNPLLIQEVQRLIAFLNGNSNRSFASLFNLINCTNKLVSEEIESVSDFQNFIMSNILSSVGSIDSSLKEPLENMFKVVGGYNTDESSREDEFYNIPITNDDICVDLYQTIHRQFFQDDNDSFADRIFLLKLPEVLTIVFEPGMNNLTGGFRVEEKFYPQIYSYEHRDILLKVIDELQSIKLRQRDLNQKTFQLRAFNGKSVHKLLSESSKHLQSESLKFAEEEKVFDRQGLDDDAANNPNACSEKDKYAAAGQGIEMVSSHVNDLLSKCAEESKRLDERAAVLQASKYDIDKLLDPVTKSKFEPWILIGVILNPVQFYYREKKGNIWIGVNISNETCKSYSTSQLTFDDIQSLTKKYTEHDFGEGMVLVYARESVFYQGDFSPLNNTLQTFINKDNEKLKEQMDILMKKDPSDLYEGKISDSSFESLVAEVNDDNENSSGNADPFEDQ